jgi:cystathionine beta-lyase/cystathionine gamma-synthase
MPALITRSQTDGPTSAIDFGVPERVVHLHIGLEGEDALRGDLNVAIAAAA